MIRQLKMTELFKVMSRCVRPVAAALLAGLCIPATEALAVTARVRLACAKDYFAHCRQFAPDSPQVRKCMRAAGDDLSPRCVNALVADGEVSEKEIAEHTASKGADE